jgi:ribonuclease-3
MLDGRNIPRAGAVKTEELKALEQALGQALGVTFRESSLLEQALVHRSYLNENPTFPLPNNERLEYLGDAVLGFVVAEKLYNAFPNLSEGEMTVLRSSLVCQETLARRAASLGLGRYLLLGRGEEATGGRKRPSNLARALEAVIAAVLQDRGIAAARKFVLKLFSRELRRMASGKQVLEYKSQLQQLIQAERQLTPIYRTVETSGPEHDLRFTVEVRVGDEVVGRGSGSSKKAAESEAARSALKDMGFL